MEQSKTKVNTLVGCKLMIGTGLFRQLAPAAAFSVFDATAAPEPLGGGQNVMRRAHSLEAAVLFASGVAPPSSNLSNLSATQSAGRNSLKFLQQEYNCNLPFDFISSLQLTRQFFSSPKPQIAHPPDIFSNSLTRVRIRREDRRFSGRIPGRMWCHLLGPFPAAGKRAKPLFPHF